MVCCDLVWCLASDVKKMQLNGKFRTISSACWSSSYAWNGTLCYSIAVFAEFGENSHCFSFSFNLSCDQFCTYFFSFRPILNHSPKKERNKHHRVQKKRGYLFVSLKFGAKLVSNCKFDNFVTLKCDNQIYSSISLGTRNPISPLRWVMMSTVAMWIQSFRAIHTFYPMEWHAIRWNFNRDRCDAPNEWL